MLNLQHEFQTARRAVHDSFIDKNAELFIPGPLDLARAVYDSLNALSPVDIARDYYYAVKEYTAQVRREQEAFQQNLQAIGIERLSRMSTREVIELCSR